MSTIDNIAFVTNSNTTSLADLLDNWLGVDKVIHYDLGAKFGEQKCIGATNTGTGTSDNHDLVFEINRLTLGVGGKVLATLSNFNEVCGAIGVLGVASVDNIVPLLENSRGCERVVGLEDMATSPLPSDFGVESTANFVNAISLSGRLVDEVCDQGDNVFWVESLKDLRRHDGFSHAGSSKRGNGIGKDIVLLTLLGQGFSEAYKSKLSSGIICLTKVAVEAGSRGCVNDAAKLLLAEVWPSSFGNFVGAVNVNVVNQIPVSISNLFEGNVAQDAGIVNDDVDSTKGLDGGINDLVTVFNRVVVSNGLTASSDNLFDNNISSL